jgi:hypothetical protein
LLIGQGIDDAEADSYASSLVRWNMKALVHCAWREIPVTYISASKDMSVPMRYQKSIIERLRAEGREVHVVKLNTGYCPNLAATTNAVDVINKVVAGKMNENGPKAAAKISCNSYL